MLQVILKNHLLKQVWLLFQTQRTTEEKRRSIGRTYC